MAEIRLTVPKTVFEGEDTTLSIEQHFYPGESGSSAAGVQWSDTGNAPWTTSEGDSGPVQAPAIPFEDRNVTWEFEGVQFYDLKFVRVAMWPDQGLVGDPLFASNAAKPKKLVEEME